jgi:hypothetical protein
MFLKALKRSTSLSPLPSFHAPPSLSLPTHPTAIVHLLTIVHHLHHTVKHHYRGQPPSPLLIAPIISLSLLFLISVSLFLLAFLLSYLPSFFPSCLPSFLTSFSSFLHLFFYVTLSS